MDVLPPLCSAALSRGMILAQATGLIAPAALALLALAGAIGVILLLPARRIHTPLRALGAVVLIAAVIILSVVVARAGTGPGMGVYFWIFSAIALAGAVRVITHPKPVYSALYFVLTVMATSGLFVLMWAEFMAAALVLIYAGAILVTYVFVIMLASEAHPEAALQPMSRRLIEYDAVSREPIAASAVGFALIGIMLFVIFDKGSNYSQDASGGATAATTVQREITKEDLKYAVAADINPGTASATQPLPGFTPVGSTQKLGAYLFDKQLVNLELAGLILTMAMVGAIVIARRRVYGVQPISPAAETVVGPSTPIDDNPHSIPVYGTMDSRQKEYPET